MIEAEGNWMLSKIVKHWYSSWHSPTGREVDSDWKVLLSIQPLHWYHWDKKAVILDRFCSNACQPLVNNTNNCAGQSGCCVDHRALPSKVRCVLARKAKKKMESVNLCELQTCYSGRINLCFRPDFRLDFVASDSATINSSTMVTVLSVFSTIICMIIAILDSAVILPAVISAFLAQVITVFFVITFILHRLDLNCAAGALWEIIVWYVKDDVPSRV